MTYGSWMLMESCTFLCLLLPFIPIAFILSPCLNPSHSSSDPVLTITMQTDDSTFEIVSKADMNYLFVIYPNVSEGILMIMNYSWYFLMCFYRNCFVFTLSHWAVCARWAPRWKEEHHDVCRHLESYSSAFRLSFFFFLGSRLMSPGKDATEEFDMLHDRKVIKKYGIDEGTVVLKGTLSKWMWQMRPAMVATFAMRPQVSLALLITGRPVRSLLEEAADRVRCSWSEDPGDPSIKKGKTWEMSFSTFAQLCWTLRFQWHIASESFILDNFFCKFFLHGFFSMTYYSRTMACEGVWKKSVGNVVVKRVQFC